MLRCQFSEELAAGGLGGTTRLCPRALVSCWKITNSYFHIIESTTDMYHTQNMLPRTEQYEKTERAGLKLVWLLGNWFLLVGCCGTWVTGCSFLQRMNRQDQQRSANRGTGFYLKNSPEVVILGYLLEISLLFSIFLYFQTSYNEYNFLLFRKKYFYQKEVFVVNVTPLSSLVMLF